MPSKKPSLHPLRRLPLIPAAHGRSFPTTQKRRWLSSEAPSAPRKQTGRQRREQRKTLVAILSMHRSGSSVTANVLRELGMSLGPFELMGAAPSNKYGHFEAMPLFELDREIHREAHGYADEELYHSPDLMQRIQRTRGRWAPRRMRKDWVARGRDFLDRLIESGDVAGFKDPRVPLIWNFWRPLLDERTDVRVVALFLLRSPHEVAMSVFTRSGGEIPYERALIACEAHLRQMHRALTSWNGDSAIVRFGTNDYFADLKNAAELCGLEWSEEIAARVVDPRERHHRAAYVAHPVQRIYKRMGGESGSRSSDRNLRILQEDAAEREALLRSRMQEARREAKRALIERTRLESQEARQVSPNEPVARSRVARNAEANGPGPETTRKPSEAGIHDRLDAMSDELAAIRSAIDQIGGTKPVRRRRRSPSGDSSM